MATFSPQYMSVLHHYHYQLIKGSPKEDSCSFHCCKQEDDTIPGLTNVHHSHFSPDVSVSDSSHCSFSLRIPFRERKPLYLHSELINSDAPLYKAEDSTTNGDCGSQELVNSSRFYDNIIDSDQAVTFTTESGKNNNPVKPTNTPRKYRNSRQLGESDGNQVHLENCADQLSSVQGFDFGEDYELEVNVKYQHGYNSLEVETIIEDLPGDYLYDNRVRDSPYQPPFIPSSRKSNGIAIIPEPLYVDTDLYENDKTANEWSTYGLSESPSSTSNHNATAMTPGGLDIFTEFHEAINNSNKSNTYDSTDSPSTERYPKQLTATPSLNDDFLDTADNASQLSSDIVSAPKPVNQRQFNVFGEPNQSEEIKSFYDDYKDISRRPITARQLDFGRRLELDDNPIYSSSCDNQVNHKPINIPSSVYQYVDEENSFSSLQDTSYLSVLPPTSRQVNTHSKFEKTGRMQSYPNDSKDIDTKFNTVDEISLNETHKLPINSGYLNSDGTHEIVSTIQRPLNEYLNLDDVISTEIKSYTKSINMAPPKPPRCSNSLTKDKNSNTIQSPSNDLKNNNKFMDNERQAERNRAFDDDNGFKTLYYEDESEKYCKQFVNRKLESHSKDNQDYDEVPFSMDYENCEDLERYLHSSNISRRSSLMTSPLAASTPKGHSHNSKRCDKGLPIKRKLLNSKPNNEWCRRYSSLSTDESGFMDLSTSPFVTDSGTDQLNAYKNREKLSGYSSHDLHESGFLEVSVSPITESYRKSWNEASTRVSIDYMNSKEARFSSHFNDYQMSVKPEIAIDSDNYANIEEFSNITETPAKHQNSYQNSIEQIVTSKVHPNNYQNYRKQVNISESDLYMNSDEASDFIKSLGNVTDDSSFVSGYHLSNRSGTPDAAATRVENGFLRLSRDLENTFRQPPTKIIYASDRVKKTSNRDINDLPEKLSCVRIGPPLESFVQKCSKQKPSSFPFKLMNFLNRKKKRTS